MSDFKSLIEGTPLLPILQPQSVEQAVSIAGAVHASGLRSIEVVRRTPVAAAAVTAILEAFPVGRIILPLLPPPAKPAV